MYTAVFLATMGSLPAEAKGRNKVEAALTEVETDDQELQEALEADGWSLTAMETDIYKPGQLYRVGSNVPEASGCVNAQPLTGSFRTTSSQGSSGFLISAGANLGKLGADATATATTFRLKSISDTSTDVIETIDFQLNKKCLGYLEKLQNQGVDLTGWTVIQQTLNARVREVTCTGQEAAIKVRAAFIARGQLGEMSDCTQSSEVSGVIAVKSKHVSDLLKAAAMAPVPPVSVADVGQDTAAPEAEWFNSLLDWSTCSFGPVERIQQDLLARGQFHVDDSATRALIIPVAKRIFESTKARHYAAKMGGAAYKSCDPAEHARICSTARTRLGDYRKYYDLERQGKYSSYPSCSRTCEPMDNKYWGYSSYGGLVDALGIYEDDAFDLNQGSDCYNESCGYEQGYYDKYRTFLKDEVKLDSRNLGLAEAHLSFIHRQILRGVGTAEMNKLIETFCE
jgi:hypothetical protein